jgi:type VI protein secretion system component VasA
MNSSVLASSGGICRTKKVLADDNAEVLPTCHFTLARDTWLQPLHIQEVRDCSSLKKALLKLIFSRKVTFQPGRWI